MDRICTGRANQNEEIDNEHTTKSFSSRWSVMDSYITLLVIGLSVSLPVGALLTHLMKSAIVKPVNPGDISCMWMLLCFTVFVHCR